MRALDPEVMDAMWAAAEPLLPVRGGDHPLGCHNPRIPDQPATSALRAAEAILAMMVPH